MRNETIGWIDYTQVDKMLKRDVTDAKVVSDMFDGSDHYTLLLIMRCMKADVEKKI